MFSHAIMLNNFFIACLTGQYLSRPIHQLILNRQGCFIIQQCLLTITLYLFTNKLSEYCVANLNIFLFIVVLFPVQTIIYSVRGRSMQAFKVERLIRCLTERG